MKKLLAGLLSAAMVFTLAGCGSSKDHLATSTSTPTNLSFLS